jgi:hypothetical protein
MAADVKSSSVDGSGVDAAAANVNRDSIAFSQAREYRK